MGFDSPFSPIRFGRIARDMKVSPMTFASVAHRTAKLLTSPGVSSLQRIDGADALADLTQTTRPEPGQLPV